MILVSTAFISWSRNTKQVTGPCLYSLLRELRFTGRHLKISYIAVNPLILYNQKTQALNSTNTGILTFIFLIGKGTPKSSHAFCNVIYNTTPGAFQQA